KMILGEAILRLANRANDLRAQISLATNPIAQLAFDRIEEQAIDGKVAAFGIGFGIAENHDLGAATVLVISFSAERGDLKFVAIGDDDDDAELAPHGDRSWKHFFDLVGQGRGYDVVIIRRSTEKEIA